MRTQTLVLEGTWEEIQKHAATFARRRVRVTVLPRRKRSPESAARETRPEKSTARFLKKFAGAWSGNDMEECLQWVYATRSKARF